MVLLAWLINCCNSPLPFALSEASRIRNPLFVPVDMDCTRLATFQSRYAIPVTVAFAVEPLVVG